MIHRKHLLFGVHKHLMYRCYLLKVKYFLWKQIQCTSFDKTWLFTSWLLRTVSRSNSSIAFWYDQCPHAFNFSQSISKEMDKVFFNQKTQKNNWWWQLGCPETLSLEFVSVLGYDVNITSVNDWVFKNVHWFLNDDCYDATISS